jgi:hypothetical protein
LRDLDRKERCMIDLPTKASSDKIVQSIEVCGVTDIPDRLRDLRPNRLVMVVAQHASQLREGSNSKGASFEMV